jgi:microcystin-dependent protein
MATNTPNLNLIKPDLTDNVDIADINSNMDILDTLLDKIYPVGSIYTNAVDNTNPGTLLGFGTWTAFGAGRVPVGFNSSETEFNAAEKTGGAKTHTLTTAQIPSHNHSVSVGTTQIRGSITNVAAQSVNTGIDGFGVFSADRDGAVGYAVNSKSTGRSDRATLNADHNHSASAGNTGGGGAHNNLQPYITVYMWKRTA